MSWTPPAIFTLQKRKDGQYNGQIFSSLQGKARSHAYMSLYKPYGLYYITWQEKSETAAKRDDYSCEIAAGS